MILSFNASPVIVLAKAAILDAFAGLGNPSIIPQAVVDEILNVDDPYDPSRIQFEQVMKPLRIVATPAISAFLAGWDLGSGESAVISCACERNGAVTILDDLAARRCAQAHGIPIIGTLGLILLAKKRGLIAEVSTALEAIVDAGLYVSDKTLKEVREKAGE